MHTKGPWRIGDAGHTIFGPKRDDGQLPARIANVCNTTEFRANGRLVAAAPDLLAALEQCLYAKDAHALDLAANIARDAIAKAKGGA